MKVRRPVTGVEAAIESEIDGVGTVFDGGRGGLVVPRRGQQFDLGRIDRATLNRNRRRVVWGVQFGVGAALKETIRGAG